MESQYTKYIFLKSGRNKLSSTLWYSFDSFDRYVQEIIQKNLQKLFPSVLKIVGGGCQNVAENLYIV